MKNKYFYEMKSNTLNIFSLILLGIITLITFGLLMILNIDIGITESDYLLIMFLLFPYFIIHEILHSIAYVVNGAKFKNITYGVHLEKGILCCSCKQEVTRKNILWSLIYPFLFIGIITYIISLIFNIKCLLVLSIANLMGCSGDLVMFYAFSKIKDFKFFEYDNPMAFGITTNEKLDDKKFFGLKRIEEKDFKQTIGRKVSVSKFSVGFIIIYYALCIINVFL